MGSSTLVYLYLTISTAPIGNSVMYKYWLSTFFYVHVYFNWHLIFCTYMYIHSIITCRKSKESNAVSVLGLAGIVYIQEPMKKLIFFSLGSCIAWWLILMFLYYRLGICSSMCTTVLLGCVMTSGYSCSYLQSNQLSKVYKRRKPVGS